MHAHAHAPRSFGQSLAEVSPLVFEVHRCAPARLVEGVLLDLRPLAQPEAFDAVHQRSSFLQAPRTRAEKHHIARRHSASQPERPRAGQAHVCTTEPAHRERECTLAHVGARRAGAAHLH